MMKILTVKLTLLAVFAGLFPTASAQAGVHNTLQGENLFFQPAAWTDFKAASNVLGQPNFTTGTSGTTVNKMFNPLRTAVDPTTGKIFVADYNNHRILRFASGAALMNGASAEMILGTTGTPGLSATLLSTPQGIFVDAGGRLWVGDRGNARVLRFNNASTIASGAAANGVLGQPNFTTNSAATSATKMSVPNDVSVDAAGRLWVSEYTNNRILRFDNAASKGNGAAADGVLGQPNFTTAVAGITATVMNNPSSVFADTGGRLWVCDVVNNRVLRFDNAAAKANGAAADGVLGQPNFTTNTAGVTQSKTSGTYGVTFDSSGRLYVADGGNNRVLIFNGAATLANGAAASNVLGQPNFTSNTANNGGISASSLSFPFYPSYDPATGSIYVGDYNNNRVLRFSDVVTAASVSIGGRILTSDGRGLQNAVVYLTKANGEILQSRTGTFGFYRFDAIEVGQTVNVSVISKRFTFSPQIVYITENIEEFNFIAEFPNGNLRLLSF